MYNTFNGYMQGMQPYGNPYADGLDTCQVLDLMDELMDTLQVIAPALYHSAMLRLDALDPSSSLPSEQASK